MTCLKSSTEIYSILIGILHFLNYTEPDIRKEGCIQGNLSAPFCSLFIHSMQAIFTPIYFWNYAVFVSSLPFFISGYNMVPKLEHVLIFNSVPNYSSFLIIYECWGRSPLGVAQKFIVLVDYSSVFFTRKVIIWRDSLGNLIRAQTLQKVSIYLSGWEHK